MTTLHKRGFLAAMAVAIPAMLIGSGLSAPPAQAGYVVTLAQQGSDVIANGSGPLDLTGLSSAGGGSNGSGVGPSSGTILTGPVSAFEDTYEGLITGPRSFGSGGFTDANSGSGSFVGIVGFVEPFGGFADFLEVPRGYMSGNALSDTSTYASKTFSTLGVTPGTYEWTWGTGANQNFTLEIGAVPAPLIGRGLPVLLAVAGLLFGAKLLERGKRHRLQFG